MNACVHTVHTYIHMCSFAAPHIHSPERRKPLLQRAEDSKREGYCSPCRSPDIEDIVVPNNLKIVPKIQQSLCQQLQRTLQQHYYYCCRRVKHISNTSTLVAPHIPPSPEPRKPRGTGVCWWMCLLFEKHRSSRELAGHISGGDREQRSTEVQIPAMGLH